MEDLKTASTEWFSVYQTLSKETQNGFYDFIKGVYRQLQPQHEPNLVDFLLATPKESSPPRSLPHIDDTDSDNDTSKELVLEKEPQSEILNFAIRRAKAQKIVEASFDKQSSADEKTNEAMLSILEILKNKTRSKDIKSEGQDANEDDCSTLLRLNWKS